VHWETSRQRLWSRRRGSKDSWSESKPRRTFERCVEARNRLPRRPTDTFAPRSWPPVSHFALVQLALPFLSQLPLPPNPPFQPSRLPFPTRFVLLVRSTTSTSPSTPGRKSKASRFARRRVRTRPKPFVTARPRRRRPSADGPSKIEVKSVKKVVVVEECAAHSHPLEKGVVHEAAPRGKSKGKQRERSSGVEPEAVKSHRIRGSTSPLVRCCSLLRPLQACSPFPGQLRR